MYIIINYNIKGTGTVKSKVVKSKENFNEYRKIKFNTYLLTPGLSQSAPRRGCPLPMPNSPGLVGECSFYSVDSEVGFSKRNLLEILPVECWQRPAIGRCCTLELAAHEGSVTGKATHGAMPCRWQHAWEAAGQSAGVSVGFVHCGNWVLQKLLPARSKMLEKQVLQQPGWSGILEAGMKTIFSSVSPAPCTDKAQPHASWPQSDI